MITITIKTVDVDTDPKVQVYNILIEDERAQWNETFTTKIEVWAFLRGLQAGAVMGIDDTIKIPEF